jgi:actin-related protein 10
VGFSGEPDPRAVFWAREDGNTKRQEAWDLELERTEEARGDRREAERLVNARVIGRMRDTFFKSVVRALMDRS